MGNNQDHTERGIARRSVLLGAAGATAGLGLLAAAPSAGAASAAGPAGATAGPAGRNRIRPNATPEPTPIGSALANLFSYRYVSFFDFTPETSTDTRRWGGYGTYTVQGGAMWASMDLPAGARVREIEWYVYNTSASSVTGLARIWTAGTGSLYVPTVDVTIGTNTTVTAYKSSVPTANIGPFLPGSKLNLGIYTTDTTGKVQVNGLRVGFDNGNANVGTFGVPIRTYDTVALHDPFGAGAIRTVTLNSGAVSPGTSAVQLMITVPNAAASGHISVWPANGAAAPAMPALNFIKGQTMSNSVLVGVTTARQIKIQSSAAVDVQIDIMGSVS